MEGFSWDGDEIVRMSDAIYSWGNPSSWSGGEREREEEEREREIERVPNW